MFQQFFNIMFALSIGKLMLNDIPHAMFEEEYATPAQLRYIAILSSKLHIPEPVVKYKGEAGRMIRHLEEELRGTKKSEVTGR
jgi:hypothetical protein